MNRAFLTTRSYVGALLATIRLVLINMIMVAHGVLRTMIKACLGGYGPFGVMLATVLLLGIVSYGPSAFFAVVMRYTLTAVISLGFTIFLTHCFADRTYQFQL